MMSFTRIALFIVSLFSILHPAASQFGPSRTIQTATNLRPDLLASADFDRDLDQDVLVVAGDALGLELSWYTNLGLGQFGPRQYIADDEGSYLFISTADINNDSFPDILATLSGGTGRIVWHRNNKDGTFAPSQLISEDLEDPIFIRCGCSNAYDFLIQTIVNTGSIAGLDAIKLFPNPTDGDITAELDCVAGKIMECVVINNLGQESYKQSVSLNTGKNTIVFPKTAFILPGTYTVILSVGAKSWYRHVVKI